MMNTLTPWRFAHWHFVVVLLLSACGGGGGGSDTPSGPPPSGSLDNQFGNGGIVKFNNTFTVGRDDAGHAIMLDGSGRILVTGYTTDDNLTRSMALWRYNANGTRDTTFGGDFNSDGIKDGFVTYNGAAGGFSEDDGEAIAVDSSGRILVAGRGRDATENTSAMVLWRYNSDGNLDLTFGNLGKVVRQHTAGGTGSDEARAITLDSNGRILVAGYSFNASNNWDMVVWRFTSTGGLDTTFGGDYDGDIVKDGFFKFDGAAFSGTFSGNHDFGNAISIDASGRILVAGASGDALNDNDMVLWRLTVDGALDATFGGDYDGNGTPDGFVKHDGATGAHSYDGAQALALDTTGRLVVVGSSLNASTGYDMVIWRFNQDGNIDTTFGGDYDSNGVKDGFVKYNRSNDTDGGHAVVLDANNRILVVGESTGNNYNDVTVWRYNSDGTLDASFGNGGVAIYDTPQIGIDQDLASGVALDANGRILVTGASSFNAGYQDMTIFRFLP